VHDSKINNHQSQVQASNENSNAQDLTRSWEKGWLDIHAINQDITMEEHINSHR